MEITLSTATKVTRKYFKPVRQNGREFISIANVMSFISWTFSGALLDL